MMTESRPSRAPLLLVLLGNGLMRIASGAGGVLVGLYPVNLVNHDSSVGAALVGKLGAVSFAAELLGALPMGVLSDRFTPRVLMVGGALLGALATQLFGLSGLVSIIQCC